MDEMTLQEAIDHAREVANGLHPNIDGCSECAKQHGQLADWLEELLAFKHVAETPADVRPVVRGRWLDYDDDYGAYSCSVCEQDAPDDTKWPYCPHCGADMREGDVE